MSCMCGRCVRGSAKLRRNAYDNDLLSFDSVCDTMLPHGKDEAIRADCFDSAVRMRERVNAQDPFYVLLHGLIRTWTRPDNLERHLLIGRFRPPSASITNGIGIWQVGFDIKHGRPVQQIGTSNLQLQAMDVYELHNTDADRIGAMRGSRGKHAVFPSGSRRQHHWFPARGPVEPGDHPDMRESVKVDQCLLVVMPRKQVDRAVMDPIVSPRLSRRIVLRAVGRANDANRRKRH